jgi:hypothetical protein
MYNVDIKNEFFGFTISSCVLLPDIAMPIILVKQQLALVRILWKESGQNYKHFSNDTGANMVAD